MIDNIIRIGIIFIALISLKSIIECYKTQNTYGFVGWLTALISILTNFVHMCK